MQHPHLTDSRLSEGYPVRPPRSIKLADNVKRWLILAGILLVVGITYRNHFGNTFHFDDGHTIVRNPWIRDIHNIPRFFRDSRTFSILPPNRSYRPLLTTSLAIDYWLGNSLAPFWFHASTLAWFGVQLSMLVFLFRRALATNLPQRVADYAALWAAALYGVHPVAAETINYIIQRGDLYATLGVTAALLLYASGKGRTGWYLLPAVAGMLSKPPALIFPVLLLFWMLQVENLPVRQALRRVVPAVLVAGIVAVFVAAMTKRSSVPSAMMPAGAYIGAQPAVLLHYLSQFFLPVRLSGDTDRIPFVSPFEAEAMAGILFLAVLLVGIVILNRQPRYRLIAFGLTWFLIASLPTSLFPLADLDNDHRMFFPFVGLALAAGSALALIPFSRIKQVTLRTVLPIVLSAAIFTGMAWGTYQRNKIWHSEESFWRDVTQKSPRNGKGWVAYGMSLLNNEDYAGALTAVERGAALKPNYYTAEMALGMIWGHMGNNEEAERRFQRAIELAPQLPEIRIAYASWLLEQNRQQEALASVSITLITNPDAISARGLLMEVLDKMGDTDGLREAALETLALFPGDRTATEALELANEQMKQAGNKGKAPTADGLVNQAMRFALQGQWAPCIAAARSAIAISPGFAMAWNNLATCQNGFRRFPEALQSAQEALRLAPDLELAKKNIAFAHAQGKVPANSPKSANGPK